MDRIDAFRAFARVVETGTFTAVARELGVSQPTVSKRVAAAEAYFGVLLFARTTRRLRPTTDGLRLYEHVRSILDALEMAEAEAGRPSETPSGVLQIAAPVSYGRAVLTPMLDRYLKTAPEVSIDLRLSESIVDLVAEGHELGIRIGELPSSSLVARRIAYEQRQVVAHKRYLNGRRPPRIPEDLAQHDCIVYAGFKRAREWVFESEFGRRVVDVNGRLVTDNADAMASAVLAGIGIAMLPSWLLREEIAAGEVEVLLPDFAPPLLPVSVIYPDRRWLSLRARSFISFLTEAMTGAQAETQSEIAAAG